MLLPVAQGYSGEYGHKWSKSTGCQVQWQYRVLPTSGNGQWEVLTAHTYQEAGINLMGALEGYSLQQVLMQLTVNSIHGFDGTAREATIPWLDHVEAIYRKMGFNPLEVGMSKLKGTVLGNGNTGSKDGNLSCFWFCQLLIEHYSNIPYAFDVLNAHAYLVKGESKMVTQYLAQAKVHLECIHHTSKMCDIPGSGYNTFTWFKACAHHISDDELCLCRTPGDLWKMSSR